MDVKYWRALIKFHHRSWTPWTTTIKGTWRPFLKKCEAKNIEMENKKMSITQ
jgi:hypothetical protein